MPLTRDDLEFDDDYDNIAEGPLAFKKFPRYEVEVDPDQDDKAKEILLCTLSRPHMRAFHCSWWAFFIAFFVWFAITPLLPIIQADLHLTKSDIWDSNIAGVAGTVLVRFLVGPLCDVYGPRIIFSVLLCTASIPAALTGLVHTARGLNVLRLFIGFAGGTFVSCQYWTSRMFTKEVVGTANGLAAGWGNLGAGVTQLIIGSILLPLIQLGAGGNVAIAWRTVCIIPAVVCFVTGIVVYRISDDAPKGTYRELKAHGMFPKHLTAWSSFINVASNPNAWIFFIQYACSFGVELTMTNAAALYFQDQFGQSTAAAGAIASIFGWLNLFARGLGGFLSDWANYKWGMRGRLWAQFICLFSEGVMVLVFANSSSLTGSIVALVFFSMLVQMTDGTNFAIIPYIDPPNMGSVCGIAGAGGNSGAVAFGFAFKLLPYKTAFLIMGCSIIGVSFTTILVHIKGYRTLFWGKDLRVSPETGEIIPAIESTLTRGRDGVSHVDK